MTHSNIKRRSLLAVVLTTFISLLNGDSTAAPQSVTKPGEDWTIISRILQQHCVACHNHETREGGLSLSTGAEFLQGGDEGSVYDAEHPLQSRFLEVVTPVDGVAEMPYEKAPLSQLEREELKRWLSKGAFWPEDVILEVGPVSDTDWWSWQPVSRPGIPISASDSRWPRHAIDTFILAKLQDEELTPSDEASAEHRIRRVYFDLIGLPPSAEEIQEFAADTDPRAFEKLVDRLLASPRYGERWGRHWLDVVHYGDTHGYDKDKPRPNAWPYRDYVIRSFNQDRPAAEFVAQQLAGDVLPTDDPESVLGTGFIAAGPWDFIGQVEVPESKIDGKIARHLDRDDMVRTTLESFCSITVGCARCHHHKFDPISQADYYQLQAVFAAVDRADRPFDLDPAVVDQRRDVENRMAAWQKRNDQLEQEIGRKYGASVNDIEKEIDQLLTPADEAKPEFGFHSEIAKTPKQEKWVQLDLGEVRAVSKVQLVGCHDTYANIGAGFGFPVRFRIELSNDVNFKEGVRVVVARTDRDFLNPGVVPIAFSFETSPAQYVRVTATQLAERANDYIFALAELQVWDEKNQLISSGSKVTSLDSIEAPERWSRANLIDGYWYGSWLEEELQVKLRQLALNRTERWEKISQSPLHRQKLELQSEYERLEKEKSAIPAPQMVYAGTTKFSPQGNFKATQGKPRTIHVLNRGNVLSPGEQVHPGPVTSLGDLGIAFGGAEQHDESDARVALASWITHADNPLFWRSMANRVWVYHFGRGLVDSPNDFGRMGQLPSHPQLLDWLASELRDSGGSIKRLHRMICTSSTYQQSSRYRERAVAVDGSNRWYWRMNRRRLEAEAIRDATLAAAGRLDLKMYGPGFQDFVIEKPEHSPHYEYHLFDPSNPSSHRRAVYRFIVRSQQQPFMTTLDCADPSMQVDKRNETITPQQSLALLNNAFMLEMASEFAEDIQQTSGNPESEVEQLYLRALGRFPTEDEVRTIVPYMRQHGLENVCRLVFNLNEFLFVD